MSTYSIIAAVSQKNRVIGDKGALLWHLPKDMQHFRSLTMGKPIIMGRKTFESIGQPLGGRKNVVITKDPNWTHERVWKYSCFHTALADCSRDPEIMVIGGASIYAQFIHLMDKLYLTIVHDLDHPIVGDATFPNWNDGLMWEEESCESHYRDDGHAYDFTFLTLRRRWMVNNSLWPLGQL